MRRNINFPSHHILLHGTISYLRIFCELRELLLLLIFNVRVCRLIASNFSKTSKRFELLNALNSFIKHDSFYESLKHGAVVSSNISQDPRVDECLFTSLFLSFILSRSLRRCIDLTWTNLAILSIQIYRPAAIHDNINVKWIEDYRTSAPRGRKRDRNGVRNFYRNPQITQFSASRGLFPFLRAPSTRLRSSWIQVAPRCA